MGRIVVGLLALVGAGFVGVAGYQTVDWLEPSIEAVESAMLGEGDGLREQDETEEVLDEAQGDLETEEPEEPEEPSETDEED